MALIGWWKFGEGTGTTAADSGTGSDDGTLINMTNDDWVTGPNGLPALDFDGSNDSVDMGDTASYDGLTAITFSAHINVSNLSSLGSVISKFLTAGNQISFLFGYLGEQVFALYSTAGNDWNYWTSTGSPLNNNTDHHIAATINLTAGTATLYIDGSAVTASKTGSGTGSIFASTAPLLIGADTSSTSPNDLVAGEIADPRVYDTILSAGEIATLAAYTGSSSTELLIADVAHAHTVDPLTLSVDYLTLANVSHSHLVDALLLVTQENLVISDISHAHNLEQLDLVVNYFLEIDALSHAHSVDQLILVPGAIPELALGTVVTYTCTIAAPTFTDLVVPISSFQMTLRQSPLQCYLNVVIPKILDYAEDISDRAAGTVTIAQVVDGVSTDLLEANISTIRTDQGATSRSGTITSYKQITFPAASSVALFGASYKSTTDGTRRYRCLPHPDIKPMDDANINGETFTVENIQWQVTAGTPHRMEILEYTP